MPVMSKMREAMPVLVIASAVLFVALIVLDWGMDILGTHNRGGATQAIGSVNGVKITYKEFDKQYNQYLDNERQQQPNVTEEMQAQVRDMIWQQFVSNTITENKLSDLGLTVTNDEVRDILVGDPPPYLKRGFTDSSGNFDLARYQENIEAIANYKPSGEAARDQHMDSVLHQLLEVEDNIRKEEADKMFRSTLAACTLVTDAEAREKFFDDNAKVDVAYLLFEASSIPDNAVYAGDDTLKAYYAAHTDEFPQAPARKAKYAFFTIAPSHRDSQTVEKKMNVLADSLRSMRDTARRNDFFDQFAQRYNEQETQSAAFLNYKTMPAPKAAAVLTTPVGGYTPVVATYDGLHVYHVTADQSGADEYAHVLAILIAPGNNSDSAKRFAGEVVAKLNEHNDSAFGKAAQVLSADQTTAEKGGDMGYVGKEKLDAPLAKAVFSAPLGQAVGPIATDKGFYVVEVLDRGNREVQVFDLKMIPHVSSETQQIVRHQAQYFHDQAAKGANPDSVAAKMDVRVFESQPLSRGTPLLGSMNFTDWIFSSKLGAVSDPMDIRGNVIVLQVSDVKEKGVLPYDQVRAVIRQKVMLRKKQDALMPKAQFILRHLNGDSLEVVMRYDSTAHVLYANNVQPMGSVPGIGTDFAFNAAAFALNNVNQISPPVRGARGLYIIQLRRKALPTDSMYELQKQVIRNSLIQQRAGAFVEQWLETQKEHAKIEDKRNLFYRDF